MDEETVSARMEQAAEGVMGAREAFQRLNVDVVDASGNMRQTADVIADVVAALYPTDWISAARDVSGLFTLELFHRRLTPRRREWKTFLWTRGSIVASWAGEDDVPGSIDAALVSALPEDMHGLICGNRSAHEVIADALIERAQMAHTHPDDSPT